MTDFYGIPAGTIPGFAEAGGGQFMSVKGLPDRTVPNMVTFMDKLRGKPDIRFSTRAGRRPVPAARTLPPGTVPPHGAAVAAGPVAPVIPQVPVRPAVGTPGRVACPLPLAGSPPGSPAVAGHVVYGIGRIDASGRVADRVVTGVLGWHCGDRLASGRPEAWFMAVTSRWMLRSSRRWRCRGGRRGCRR